jgi:hypothetical protein
MRRFFKYTVLYVTVPDDFGPSEEYYDAKAYALDLARDKIKTWAVPALWSATFVRTNYFESTYRVVRRSAR